MKTKSKLPAFTLIEMLIVIILAGILFLVLFDGLGLVKRYMVRMKQTVFHRRDLLDSYRYLEGLFQRCDSVKLKNGNEFYFYWENELKSIAGIKDSLMYANSHEITDTLLRKVIGFKVRIKESAGSVDSLTVWLLHKGRSLYFCFGVRKSVGLDDQKKIKKVEEQYNNIENDEWNQKP